MHHVHISALREYLTGVAALARYHVDDSVGMPTSWAMRPISSAVPEVNSEGLTTAVQPAARANGSFWASIRVEKFHGMIMPTAPMGSRTTVPL